MALSVDDVVARCSRYSGFNLRWKLVEDQLTIWDPRDYHNSVLIVTPYRFTGGVREVYGRLWQWAITPEESEVLACEIRGPRSIAPVAMELPTDF